MDKQFIEIEDHLLEEARKKLKEQLSSVSRVTIEHALKVVASPKWKFWNTAHKRVQNLALLTVAATDRTAVLLDALMANGDRLNAEKVVLDIFVRGADDNQIANLVVCGTRTRDLSQMTFIAEVFADLGARAKQSVPILSAWVSGKSIQEVIKFTGLADLDDKLAQHLKSKMSLQEYLRFDEAENFMMSELRLASAKALGKMGFEAAKALPYIRLGLERESAGWKKGYFEDAIENIEKSIQHSSR